jgi:ADP-ribose pyrophosphatase YjhB (NUDIX family)
MSPGKEYIGVGVGVFIFNEKSELLLMKRGPKSKNEIGAWIVPGGTVDFGETLREAAIREVREELAVDIEITDQLPAYEVLLPEESQHWVTNVFSAKIISGTPEIKEPEKCEALGWFSLNALPSPIARASTPAIEYYQNRGK